MATCKDCLHYEVCIFHITENENEKCPHFKDKSQYAEVKHGKWIKRRNERTCSKCRFIYYNSNDDFNYCPNCGTDMQGGCNNG